MKLTEGYYKTTIAGVPYLLSYGQESAQSGLSLRLNRTASLLWDGLCEDAGEPQLLHILAREFEADEEDFPLLQRDIQQFLQQLCALGILSMTSCEPAVNTPTQYFRIGPITIAYTGAPFIYDTYFSAFSCSKAPVDLSISIVSHIPFHKTNGTILVRTQELTICDAKDRYLFLFPEKWGISEMHIAKNGSWATLFCYPDTDAHAEEIFHALRFAFLVAAQNHDLLVIHSASLLYQNQAWLFSGCSGTGKSTHTNLWHSEFGSQLLNGDLNMIGMHNGIPIVYGLPWCGTSEIFTVKDYPLGGIVFLKQSTQNHVAIPSSDQKALLLLQRLISPSWTRELNEKNLRLAEQISGKTKIFTLACTKEPQAAHIMRKAIDSL